MPICLRCKEDKETLDFGFMVKLSRYDATCRKCRRKSHKSGECEKLRAAWNALGVFNPFKKPRKK